MSKNRQIIPIGAFADFGRFDQSAKPQSGLIVLPLRESRGRTRAIRALLPRAGRQQTSLAVLAPVENRGRGNTILPLFRATQAVRPRFTTPSMGQIVNLFDQSVARRSDRRPLEKLAEETARGLGNSPVEGNFFAAVVRGALNTRASEIKQARIQMEARGERGSPEKLVQRNALKDMVETGRKKGRVAGTVALILANPALGVQVAKKGLAKERRRRQERERVGGRQPGEAPRTLAERFQVLKGFLGQGTEE